MLKRFEGTSGRRLLVEMLISQKMVLGNRELAELLADRAKLQQFQEGEYLIKQDDSDNSVFFVLAGQVQIVANGRLIATRMAGEHVGEMAAIEPSQKRSASVIATEECIVASIDEPTFAELANRYPDMYKQIARELARRLLQRNSLLGAEREKVRVFIISSAEALPVARIIQSSFAHEKFITSLWTDGVFKVTGYMLQALEDQIAESDFAIAIAHSDDLTESRGKNWPAPRDNVIFELGMFMGRLGKERAILMEPREDEVKLPSDLAGVVTVPYKYEKGKDAVALMAPACNVLRDYINENGPRAD